MPNEIIVAAAGGGKTTRIVDRALACANRRIALVTYTNNNVGELQSRFYEKGPIIPCHVEVWSWYRFLLYDFVRPYQRALLSKRVEGLHFVSGRSAHRIPKSNLSRYFLSDGGRLVYSDKIAELALELNRASNGAVVRRVKERFAEICVDEIQDMAGYDLELLELLLRSGPDILLVGDHRQATFRTNQSPKNSAFAGPAIINKFRAWERGKLAALNFERESHRCNQHIADLADAFFPNEPTTISKNTVVTGHDGVFLVRGSEVSAYLQKFKPQVLRLDRKTDCNGADAMNFGEAKGLTFERVLIFPHAKGKQWLKTGDFSHVAPSAAKLYVGITRARYSVAFVYDGESSLTGVARYLGGDEIEG